MLFIKSRILSLIVNFSVPLMVTMVAHSTPFPLSTHPPPKLQIFSTHRPFTHSPSFLRPVTEPLRRWRPLHTHWVYMLFTLTTTSPMVDRSKVSVSYPCLIIYMVGIAVCTKHIARLMENYTFYNSSMMSSNTY